VQKPGNPPLAGSEHGFVEPRHLCRLVRDAAAEDQRIEPDEAPAGDILNPPIGPEPGSPTLQPHVIDGLKAVACLADIVIAGKHSPAPARDRDQIRSVGQIVIVLRAVDGYVPGMNDEVRPV
jgi:hypothetical protein